VKGWNVVEYDPDTGEQKTPVPYSTREAADVAFEQLCKLAKCGTDRVGYELRNGLTWVCRFAIDPPKGKR